MGLCVWRRRAAAAAVAAAAILLISSLPSPSVALTADGLVLIEIKEGFLRAAGAKQMPPALRSWRETDTIPCNWTGVTCHHPHLATVRSIDLPFMKLGGVISPSIGKLQRLQRLSLHHNSLNGIIPSEIGNCMELRALYLRANYLQGSIPPEIGQLNHLIILDLSSNLLKGPIPPIYWTSHTPSFPVPWKFRSVWPPSAEAMSPFIRLPCNVTP